MLNRRTCFIAIICLFLIIYLNLSKQTIPPARFSLRSQRRITPVRKANPKASKEDRNIAIVEVVGGSNTRDSYNTAIDGVECFAASKGHAFFLLKMEDFSPECGHHQDFFYRRHCIVHYLMTKIDYEWIVFLDSDIDVVNPNRSIHEFLSENFDVYFYDRVHNWELMAGSYLVRNNEFGRKFLKYFANFEWMHPKSKHHATDNGAIQAVIADIYFGNRGRVEDCWDIWRNSSGWDDIFNHEWCVRKKLGARSDFGRIRLLPKGLTWAREAGVTGGKFCLERDFMLHGHKEWTRVPFGKPNGWYDTRETSLNASECEFGPQNWVYQKEMIITPCQKYCRICNSPREQYDLTMNNSAYGIPRLLEEVMNRLNLTEQLEMDKNLYADVIEWQSTIHKSL